MPSETSLKNLRPGNPKHWGWPLLRRGELPADKVHIKEYLEHTEAELIAACGGPEKLGIRDGLLIEQLVRKLGYQALVDEYLWRHGPFKVTSKGQVKAQPALSSFYLALSNSIRLDLAALGIKERAEPVLTLAAYMAQREEQERAKETSDEACSV